MGEKEPKRAGCKRPTYLSPEEIAGIVSLAEQSRVDTGRIPAIIARRGFLSFKPNAPLIESKTKITP